MDNKRNFIVRVECINSMFGVYYIKLSDIVYTRIIAKGNLPTYEIYTEATKTIYATEKSYQEVENRFVEQFY